MEMVPRKISSLFALLMILMLAIGFFQIVGMREVYASADILLWDSLASEVSVPAGEALSAFGIMEVLSGLFVVTNDGDIYRSSDGGQTWSLSIDAGLGDTDGTFVTSNGSMIVPLKQRGDDWFVSTDGGVTWKTTGGEENKVPIEDGFVELSNGTVYLLLHGKPYVYKTTDLVTFKLVWNFTQILGDMGYSWENSIEIHGHAMAYDPAYDRWYVALGDVWIGPGVNQGKLTVYSDDGGSSWTVIEGVGGPVSREVTVDGVFFGPDSDYADVWLFNRENQTVELDVVRLHGGDNFVYDIEQVNNVLYVATMSLSTSYNYGIYVSPDLGKTWAVLKEVKGMAGLFSLYPSPVGDYVWVYESPANRLYRLRALTHREAVWLIHGDNVSVSVSTLVYSAIVGDGADWIDLGGFAVKKAKLTLVGASYRNWLNNSGFETGDGAGWILSSGYMVTSSASKHGAYSLSYVAPASTKAVAQNYVSAKGGSVIVNTVWAKADKTVIGKLRLYVYWANETHSYYSYATFNLDTAWRRLVKAHRIPEWATKAKFLVYVLANDATIFIDSAMMEISNPANPAKQYSLYRPHPYFEGVLNSVGPSVTIGG
jgi:hypothetical protein